MLSSNYETKGESKGMNKSSIKSFAIWARNKLIADISYRAGLMGITAEGIKNALPQSTGTTEFYDIGTDEPYSISGDAVKQRIKLVEVIRQKEKDTDYQTAYKYLIEEVAYTWFNRLIAIRFMEVNDYLPSHTRVLSSDTGKLEPDIVTNPFDAELDCTSDEEQKIMQLKNDNQLDELFRMLFIKQCNALNEYLPALFEKTNDYTEVLLNLSVIDQEGVIYKLVHDIDEDDFNVEKGGQVEIIGWLYQYYNTEPKADVFGRPSGTKIKKEDVPAATQLFTPDWIVRYMVENSLGRLWVEGHPNDELKANWKYYLEEAEQEPEVQEKLAEIRREYSALNPENLKCIDPCMGSGHILVYLFDVLMQIYESQGYSQRDAAQSILQNNLYGLDIDDRAAQMAYFAVMMKARQYDRRILTRGIEPHVFAIEESNDFNRNQLAYFGADLSEVEKNSAQTQVKGLLDQLHDAKEYGSMLTVDNYDWDLLHRFAETTSVMGQLSMDTVGIDESQNRLNLLVTIGQALANKYLVTVTNPPYMPVSHGSIKLQKFAKTYYPNSKADLFAMFIERGCQFTKLNGMNAMVTMQSWMFLSSFENMRKDILAQKTICNLMHMENMVMGIAFGTAVSILYNLYIDSYKGTYNYVRYKDIEDDLPKVFPDKYRFSQVGINNYAGIQGSPIAYWISKKMLNAFQNYKTIGEIAPPKQGLATADNNSFLRLWFETDIRKIGFGIKSCEDSVLSKKKWFPYNKGGAFRRWYGNRDYVVNWENDGALIKNFKDENGKVRSRPQNLGYYFKPAITWSDITSAAFSGRYCETGFMFDIKGSSGFPSTDKLFYTLGFLNSKISQACIKILNPTVTTQVGDMSRIPVAIIDEYKEQVDTLVKESVNYAKEDWNSFENAWEFKKHPLLKYIENDNERRRIANSQGDMCALSPIKYAYTMWMIECDERFQKLKKNEEELNNIFIDIYGLQAELTPEVEDKDVTVRKADFGRDIRSFISYAVGCMFGRYSLDTDGLAYAGGEWDDGKYKTFIPDADNVLPITDEEYLEDDIVGLFCAWLKKVFGEDSLEANLDFVANALGNKGNTNREVIRNYFLNDFFKDHCNTYSVTGSGKRPIYWLFDSGKQNGFKALVYLHRYTPDTIGNLRVDYLHKMQRIYESEMNRMQDTIDHSTNSREVAAATKRKEKLQKQLKECREYDEKIGHLALSRIELDLDDGVKVNYRKVQTASDGKFYEVLADSKKIMAKKK